MLQGSANILDQLLGGVDVQASGQAGMPVSGEQPSTPFGEMLAMLAGDNGFQLTPRTDLLQAQADAVPFETLIPTENVEAALQQAVPTTETTANSDIASLLPGADILGTQENALVQNADSKVLTQNVENDPFKSMQPAMPTDSQMVVDTAEVDALVARAAIQNPNIQNLFDNQPELLESAIYKVLDSKVDSGKLELTVAGDGDLAEPVKISVPTELLADAKVTRPNDAQSVEHQPCAKTTAKIPLFDTQTQKTIQFEELVSRLNLKAVDIKLNDQVESAVAQKQPVVLSIVAEDAGSQVIIKSNLRKQDIETKEITRLRGTVEPQNSRSHQQSSDIPGGVLPNSSRTRSAFHQVAVPSKLTTTKMPFDIADRIAGVETQQSTTSQVMFSDDSLIEKGAAFSKLSSQVAETPRVRLSIPETFDKPLKAGGQSIMLRIEPDHLGPARLHLTMRNDLLTARVSVDSPAAKAAVEASLDQLTEQLSRAGVEVDRIEVTLDSDTQHRFLDQRPSWTDGREAKNRKNDDDFEIDQVTMSQAVMAAAAQQYVGSSGVNLLA